MANNIFDVLFGNNRGCGCSSCCNHHHNHRPPVRPGRPPHRPPHRPMPRPYDDCPRCNGRYDDDYRP